jgi:hypothetical protein
MIRPLTSFQLGDVITGEPHLRSPWLTDCSYLAWLEQEPRELGMRAAAAIHFPHKVFMACSAAAILFCLVGLATAQSPQSIGRTTPECAERDLKVLTLIEEHGNVSDLPASTLAEAGFAQLDARLTCLSGRHVEALAKYDQILASPRLARQATR